MPKSWKQSLIVLTGFCLTLIGYFKYDHDDMFLLGGFSLMLLAIFNCWLAHNDNRDSQTLIWAIVGLLVQLAMDLGSPLQIITGLEILLMMGIIHIKIISPVKNSLRL